MLYVPSLKIPPTMQARIRHPFCRGHERQRFFIVWTSYTRFEGIERGQETVCKGPESTSFQLCRPHALGYNYSTATLL